MNRGGREGFSALIDPSAPADKPETAQMKVIHKALRREFRLLPDLVAGVAAGDTGRAGRIAGHASLILGMLHEHHESEDELLWPLLRARVPLEESLLQAMEVQHQTVAALVGMIQPDLPAWSRTADLSTRDRLTGHLRQLHTALEEHLALEETAVLPLIHEHLTVPEWLAPQHAAMKKGPSGLAAKLILAGAVLEDATPGEQAWFLSTMPPPARVLWRVFGTRLYSRINSVRGAADAGV
ncbi:hemerythrin domain-containing protein [Actinoallomurus purpureus]|uniref:hemerythrin domain-containing protein n=1 Tax=Actinoallomurus purpureus TaxID=478114 RepID=UPI002093A077|nr:hemerythrin domain-containing protein [Actinoallomurus purpureus]MCO6003463.1 hemerythrin domain-containing protein [Actinoallomurus purpureus]